MPQEQIMKIRLAVNKDNGDDEIKRSMVQTMTMKMAMLLAMAILVMPTMEMVTMRTRQA